ncbi:leukocyte immunoglobulin-like receptor subfamily B member 4 [Cavia porcellus]|uniref:leukocyte immunoglobulin-like receptor subfamily B member 4 n=1 Tax=Cavia porcellus TaxID=10141 RepID=UPI002FE2CE8C
MGVSVASSLVLFVLLLLFRFWRQRRSQKADAAVQITEPEGRVELDTPIPPDEDPQGVTCAQVKHSEPRRSGDFPPSLKDRHSGEDRQMDAQDAASESPQEVAYAQVGSWMLGQGTAVPPSSQDVALPAECSV